ncbi:hypothetical protein FRB99_001482 [Tulasnella sp. 403]|nr:hypothetical protein FRB99_001482 [Tulasnella sp. 403]
MPLPSALPRPTQPRDSIDATNPSTSSTRYPQSTPTPTPAPQLPIDQQVLYVAPDGSSHWSPSPEISRSRRAKRRMDEGKQPVHNRARRDLLVGTGDKHRSPSLEPRVDYPSCDEEGNNVLSCYPSSNTTVLQGEWTKFVWNARIPDFIGLPGQVDIYLYHADSGQQVANWTSISNVQSQINVLVNDSFWDYRMSQWQPGQHINYTYYFVIVKAGTVLDGGEEHQATWTAVQTALADSVYLSSSSVISQSSVSSISALSALGPTSLSLLSVSSLSRISATATAGLQSSQSSSDDFPGWAIALIVILGLLAFVSITGLSYIILRNLRRNNHPASQLSHRGSLGSSSPMMVQAPTSENPHSPATMTSAGHNFARMGAPPVIAAPVMPGAAAVRSNSLHYSGLNDGASTQSASDAGPFSGQDAAIMADAFRMALRKPDFGSRPVEESESPEASGNTPEDAQATVAEPDVLSRELAEEGRDIRSVSSVRGVTVQSLEDGSGNATGAGNTATNRIPS